MKADRRGLWRGVTIPDYPLKAAVGYNCPDMQNESTLDVRAPALRPLAFDGNFGLEREALRVTADGRMAHTPHPFPADHPRIVRDFCENQTEINTGASDGRGRGRGAEGDRCNDPRGDSAAGRAAVDEL